MDQKDIVAILEMKDLMEDQDVKERRVRSELQALLEHLDKLDRVAHLVREAEMDLMESRALEVRMVPQAAPDLPDLLDQLAILDSLDPKVLRVTQDLMVNPVTMAPQVHQEQMDPQAIQV